MTIYYHHVGDDNAARDFPRTIGREEVRKLRATDLADFSHLVPIGIEDFQIWGIPSKAERIYRNLQRSDWVLLIGTTGEGGGIEYIGKVDYVIPQAQNELSKFLWTEDRFPWIFLMHGEMRYVPWPEFLGKVGYEPNFEPRGKMFGISDARLRGLGYKSDFAFIEALGN